nr:PREDICTED: uncharacterized protein LOC109037821 [Bemisia tabaci]
MVFIIVLLSSFLMVLSFSTLTSGQECPGGLPVTFAKVTGKSPRTYSPPVLLYASEPGVAITAECYNRCRRSTECTGFIVDYARGACFRFSESSQDAENLIITPNANYFRKVCLQVPKYCSARAWPIEYMAGVEMVGMQYTSVNNVIDRWHCAQLCLSGSNQYNGYDVGARPCLSAVYNPQTKVCSLSSENRRTRPEAFSPSAVPIIEYIENECINVSDESKRSCWHDPIPDQALLQVDLQEEGIDYEQCKRRCETEQYFNCLGFTHHCPLEKNDGKTLCQLHSDDRISAGPLALRYSQCASYTERLPCIDLTVSCSQRLMSITLHSKGFNGRLFALGHSDSCGVSGRNQIKTILPIPLTQSTNMCGVIIAYSSGEYNRTVASAIVVVQRHPIIQTAGDRVVKVSCAIPDDTTPYNYPRPSFNNITLDTSFGVSDPGGTNGLYSETISNISSTPPTYQSPPIARLRVRDLSQGGEDATETMLGDDLEFRVDIDPPYNVSVLKAGHLVASSGDARDSLLLLDWRGCPPEPQTFPALTPEGPNSLVAVFKAFRFPSSPILRFSLVLTPCEKNCQPVYCGNGVSSLGRTKRATLQMQEIPLQLSIIVRPLDINETANTTDTSRQLHSGTKSGFGLFKPYYNH